MKRLCLIWLSFAAILVLCALMMSRQTSDPLRREYLVALNEIEQLSYSDQPEQAAIRAAELRKEISAQDTQKNPDLKIWVTCGICLLFSAALTGYYAREVVRPFEKLSSFADKIASGNFDSDEDFSKLVIAQVSYYVNVRDIPSEDGEVVGKLYNNSAGEWLDKDGDWYKIKSGSVTGYVKSEFVVSGDAAVELAKKVGERVAVVNTTTLKVRESASLDAPVLGLVPMEDRLTVVEENDNWCKVSIEEGDGWVSKEYVKVSTEFPKAESKAEEEARIRKEEAARKAAIAAANRAASRGKSSGKSGKGSKSSGGGGGSYSASGGGPGASVANYALQFVGNPYVYGGSSLTGGTDCSGFTMSVYRNFGVSLPHSSGAQRSMGYSVGGLANAQAGDIVCYSGHVGIYIGGGQIVHASTAKTGIKVSNAGYRSVLDVRRIF